MTSQLIDLGNLGEPNAFATAVSGGVVVGEATLPGGGSRAFAYDLGATVPRMRDLGTLRFDSTATDVDASIVVGESSIGNGATHAFAYDLAAPNPRMLDLGTLGGESSTATAVDGTVVVGNAQTTAGDFRAFAYDLSAATPAMRSLGTFGGSRSNATAVDGGVVVGSATLPSDDFDEPFRAFAYDLQAASPHLQNLGVLPGTTGSTATRVSGRFVVGRALPTSGLEHAFAYDLDAAAPRMRDLGALGETFNGSDPGPYVDRSIVVGESSRRDGPKFLNSVFAADMSLPSPRRKDLGTLGGDFAFATGVSGDIVVGKSNFVGYPYSDDTVFRAFAYDLDPSIDRITDLARAPGLGSDVADVDGNLAVGSTYGRRTGRRAVAWRLSRTTAPAVRFSRFASTVREDRKTASVTVVRDGDASPPVQVRYRTRAYTATTGRDFRATSRTLRFAAGQTRRTFAVPIVNDNVPEGPETFLVDLVDASDGAVLGTPRSAKLTIRESDQQPDTTITIPRHPRFIGNNIYNTSAARQTKVRTSRRGHTRIFYVRIHNDGTQSNTFTLRGSRPRHGSRIRYTQRGTDLTTALQSRTGLPLTFSSGRGRISRQIRVQITVLRNAPLRRYQPATLTATWAGDDTRVDRVKASVKVIP